MAPDFMEETTIQYYPDIKQGSIAAAKQILQLAQTAILDKGLFTFVLTGGRTPKLLYQLLSQPSTANQMPWQQSHFFWGDERWVSSSHPDSNFNLANETLLTKVQIPPQNIHQISTGHPDVASGAEMYEKHLRDFFHSIPQTETGKAPQNISYPEFDMILLGMGTDGHTASLFPGSPLLHEKIRWVSLVGEKTGSPPVQRITLTLPVLNHARNVIFLVAGPEKHKIVETILHEPEKAKKMYPAAMVKPTGKLTWIVAEK
jgi:6-phosphogluconolactonase